MSSIKSAANQLLVKRMEENLKAPESVERPMRDLLSRWPTASSVNEDSEGWTSSSELSAGPSNQDEGIRLPINKFARCGMQFA
jgi:hypothetical protein